MTRYKSQRILYNMLQVSSAFQMVYTKSLLRKIFISLDFPPCYLKLCKMKDELPLIYVKQILKFPKEFSSKFACYDV